MSSREIGFKSSFIYSFLQFKGKCQQEIAEPGQQDSGVQLLSKSNREQIHQDGHGERFQLPALADSRGEEDKRNSSSQHSTSSLRSALVSRGALFARLSLLSCSRLIAIDQRYGFVTNPTMVLVATPQVGEKEVSYSAITDWIALKLKQEFQVSVD